MLRFCSSLQNRTLAKVLHFHRGLLHYTVGLACYAVTVPHNFVTLVTVRPPPLELVGGRFGKSVPQTGLPRSRYLRRLGKHPEA